MIAGGTTKPKEIPNPAPEWISERSWNDIQTLPSLTKFREDFKNHLEGLYSFLNRAFYVWNFNLCII